MEIMSSWYLLCVYGDRAADVRMRKAHVLHYPIRVQRQSALVFFPDVSLRELVSAMER
jgi:hypothetical protein